MYNKRAQIGETITWGVATVIILIILIVSVFIASIAGHSKFFPTTNKIDLFAGKSLTAYLLTNDSNNVSIYNEINTGGQLNNFNGILAQSIFTSLYSGYYNRQVFLGLATNSFTCLTPFNPLNYGDFFGSGYCTYTNNYFPISGSVAGARALDDPNAVVSVIYLINNKYIQLVLWHL
jgi:hypothetical protein